MRVWIDLANSPHPLLFAPVARRLEELGHEVVVTARDNAQTVELALERFPDAEVIGGESPVGRARKARALADRVRVLRRWAKRRRPDVAFSHNSYGQIVAAESLGMRVVTAMDFEHQPANHLAFRLAHRILVPRAIDAGQILRQGARGAKVSWYEGLKEEIYLSDFKNDPAVLDDLGIVRDADSVVVVARTPPSRAAYHQYGNSLFYDALKAVDEQPKVVCVVLTRHEEQRKLIEVLGLRNSVVPDHAVDSRSLMYAADLVLGAGGTMTREAALLGVPTYTLFAGETPAVDRWLLRRGMMRRLERVEQLRDLARTPARASHLAALDARAEEIIGHFVEAVTTS